MRDLIAASFLALGFSVIGSSCVSAQTAEQQCSHEWQALKSSGNTQGWTEPAFMTGCKNHHTFSTNPSGLGSAEPTSITRAGSRLPNASRNAQTEFELLGVNRIGAAKEGRDRREARGAGPLFRAAQRGAAMFFGAG
jgi:hypothetical protein